MCYPNGPWGSIKKTKGFTPQKKFKKCCRVFLNGDFKPKLANYLKQHCWRSIVKFVAESCSLLDFLHIKVPYRTNQRP